MTLTMSDKVSNLLPLIRTVIKVILVGLIFWLLYQFYQKNLADRSIIIGNPDNIVIVSPENSQDVIVIGDPDQVKVKPKKNK